MAAPAAATAAAAAARSGGGSGRLPPWGKRAAAAALGLLPVGITFSELVGSCMFVDGRSMQPTLNPGHDGSPSAPRDLVLVWKWPVKVWRQFRKGDVVVLRSPTDPGTKVVKRLTGAEREWRTRRTGVRQEPIPEGFCWVTGDNPLFSEDSSLYGPIPLALIEGRVSYILWPPSRMGAVPKRPPPVPRAQLVG